jgi:hypothetical protein
MVSQSEVLVSSPIWSPWLDIYFCLTVTFLFPWGALSDERTGLSFVCAAGPCQRSVSRVLVPWDLRPYFILRLPLSSIPTTRRVTVKVLDPASTRVWLLAVEIYPLKQISRTGYRPPSLTVVSSVATIWLLKKRLTVKSIRCHGSMGFSCRHCVAMDLYFSLPCIRKTVA